MLNCGIIPCMKTKKLFALVIVMLFVLNMSFTADGFSVKLRGKLALAGILSGVAILTISLVKHDRDVSENLLSELGRADYIWQIDCGFEAWYVHQYQEQSYYFLNNRYIREKSNASLLESSPIGLIDQKLRLENRAKNKAYFTSPLIDTTFLADPKRSSFSLLHQQRVPLSVILHLYQSADGRWLNPDQWHYHLKLQKSHLTLWHLPLRQFGRTVSPILSNSQILSKVPPSN